MVFTCDISGYLPKDSLTAFPFRPVFIFQSFEPVGAISRYRPLPSKRGIGLVFGFCVVDLFGYQRMIRFAIWILSDQKMGT